MKIGIMTFWWSEDNYGQLLQCYALQKFLRKLGHDAYLIRYDPRNDYIKTTLILKLLKVYNARLLTEYIYSKLRVFLSNREQNKNPRRFEQFRDQNIEQSERIYTSYAQLLSDPPDADAYIVGSDQVWNFYNQSVSKCRNLIHAYFLDFGKASTKRLSYAASWSVEKLRDDYINEISPLIKKFTYVSVREKSGIALCKKLGVEASWVADPTFLLEKKDYHKLFPKESAVKQKKPYLFLYMLGNDLNYSIREIYKWATLNNLDVVYITGNNFTDPYKKTFATIPEWLSLLYSAKFVITNSFHCCAFSMIFHKQFAVIPIKGRYKEMNTRLDSLWKQFDIDERYLLNNDYSVLTRQYSKRSKINTEFLTYI